MTRYIPDRKINFAIAGVQKAGTTALARYLDQHNDLYLPPEKELHIFKRNNADLAPVEKLIAKRYKHAPPLLPWGEATPIYTYWPDALELMHGHNPDMKLIISLRHPVARAYSHWSMETRRGRETETFSHSIREGRSRVEAANRGVHLVHSYVERGFYAEQIRHVLSIFPAEQVFFLRADQISADNPILQNLLRFLDVGPISFQPIETNVHPSSLPPTSQSLDEDFAYLQQVFAKDMAQLSKLTALDLDDWLQGPPAPSGQNWSAET
ncbi:MAG: sulfotransferase [Robiginitomaculum sp.]|nr:MAG: sulfotransferase [Robiginitomaculum sp.]